MCGNFADEEDRREISYEEALEFALENNYFFMETSCLKMINVKNIFEFLIKSTFLKIKTNNKPDNTITLKNENKNNNKPDNIITLKNENKNNNSSFFLANLFKSKKSNTIKEQSLKDLNNDIITKLKENIKKLENELNEEKKFNKKLKQNIEEMKKI